MQFLPRVPTAVWIAVMIGILLNLSVLTYIITHYSGDIFVSGDAIGYVELAQNLVKGNGFVRQAPEGTVFETFRTPGLPLLLGAFLWLGLGVGGYVIFISLIGAIILPITTWYLGEQLFSRRVGILAACLLVAEPLMWFMSWAVVTEIPFMILASLASVCLLEGLSRERPKLYLYAGLLFALAVYVRPGMWLVIAVVLLTLFGYRLFIVKERARGVAFTFVTILLLLSPWFIKMHQETGVYSLSGTGWRNVYTDYLASLRAVGNGTNFGVEKEQLKDFAGTEWGLSRNDINSPANTTVLRNYALPEIFSNIPLVIKLQSLLFLSYFTHTDYKIRFERVGLLPKTSNVGGRTSITQLVLEKGLGSIPVVFSLLKEQYFIPVLERLWALSLLAFALLGFFVTRNNTSLLIAFVLALGYLTSSAIGFGVEGRLRVPLLPLYFMLTAVGIWFVYDQARFWLIGFAHEND